MTPTHCISCGSEVPDHAKFCHACGSAVYRPEDTSQPPEPAPDEFIEISTTLRKSDPEKFRKEFSKLQEVDPEGAERLARLREVERAGFEAFLGALWRELEAL